MNPYYGTHFFTFFATLLKRLFTLSGPLAPDELQILVLAGCAISAAIVGTLLVLRRLTMLANSLSHTILLGLVLGYLITRDPFASLLVAALLTAIVTALLTQFLERVTRLQTDAANGLVFTTLFALGIALATLYTRNLHIGLDAVTGNVDALHPMDLRLTALVLAFNLVVILVLFKEHKHAAFDRGHTGPRLAMVMTSLLMLQTSATAISAFRAVGVIMLLSLLVGPPLAARRLTRSIGVMMAFASGIGVVAAILGVALSRHILTVWGVGVSTGGLVVVLIGLIYAGSLLLNCAVWGEGLSCRS